MMLVRQLKLIKTMIEHAGVGKPGFNPKPRQVAPLFARGFGTTAFKSSSFLTQGSELSLSINRWLK